MNSEMASSSSTPLHKYDVFLSFRGEDTRKTFVSHLHAALDQRGIRTFFDAEDLEKGQSISFKLLKSIEESKFAIIVFSENYYSSAWCLDELVQIMECKSKNGLRVIPIFYHIDPSDLRKQTNISFIESFTKHEVRFKDNMEKVQIWKDSLREAANISGHDFNGRNVEEAKLIKEIVEDISSKLPLQASVEGLFGIEHHLEKLRKLLAQEPNASSFFGIWGMGGIGKTTIARAIFNEHINGFEGQGCFLQDVCKKDIVDLQKAILSKFIRSPENINNEYEGSDMIRNRLKSKRVLLVLDDVDNTNQLALLARKSEWFGDGSRIIVTTRDKHLLDREIYKVYEVEMLSKNEAMQLFCYHALKRDHPGEIYYQLAESFVRYANGLPLALKVLGSHLHGREVDVWESTLNKITDNPDNEIINILKISFDGLDDIQQKIFLDIACFYRGCLKKEVAEILDSFGFYPVDGITVLIDKSLIHISSKEKIQMHDLIQKMGRDIVRKRANNNPERYSRLWKSEDIIKVLKNSKGTGEVEALVLRENDELQYSDDEHELSDDEHELSDDEHELIDPKTVLSEETFGNTNRLRLLEIQRSNFEVIPDYLPSSLQFLSWFSYPGKSLPRQFKPNRLVNLNLSGSLTLETFPDIRSMPNLKYLNLTRCKNLLKVPPSVEVHEKLIDLNLSSCVRLKKFPRIEMKSLETLILYKCKKLKSLPEFHSNMIRLRILDMEFTHIKNLPRSVEGLTNLQEISMHHNSILPNIFRRCKNEVLTLVLILPLLQKVVMTDCKISEIILPENIGCLTSLQELDLSLNDIISLPESINRFSSLQVLRLSFSWIKELPELPTSITELVLDYCKELTPYPNLVNLLHKYKNLRKLSLVQWEQVEAQFLLDWESLRKALCTRQEALEILLPSDRTFDKLYEKTEPQTTVTLSPSWYNDKLQGFLIFATTDSIKLRVRGIHCKFKAERSSEYLYGFHTAFFYIPIAKIASGRDWNEQRDCCLFEVANFYDVESWGVRLVYDGDSDLKDTNDFIIDNHSGKDTSNPYSSKMKVCVTPRNHIQ